MELPPKSGSLGKVFLASGRRTSEKVQPSN